MNRRKVCSLSIAFLLGIAIVEYQLALLWWMLLLYGGIWIYSLKQEYPKSRGICSIWILLFVAAILTGCLDSYGQNVFRKTYESQIKDGKECLVQGEINQRVQEEESTLYYLKNCKVQLNQKNYSCNQILLNLKAEEYSIGEILCVKGKIKTFSLPANEGNYNERSYYYSLKIDFRVEGKQVLGVYGKRSLWKETLYGFKEKIKDSFRKAMPKADAGVLIAMVLGDKSEMDAERKNMYQDAGISHFYSISGLHISMIGMALYHFLRKRGGSYLLSGGIAAVLILLYGELIGYGISASRAIGMFLVLMYGKFRGRTYDRVTALALLAVILAGENPGLLRHAGFLLSFGAVTGVILAEYILSSTQIEEIDVKFKDETTTDDKKKIKLFLKEKVSAWKENIIVSICIQITTIPIMCQFFYEISVYTILVNLVVLPCMGLLLGMGILGGIAGCFFELFSKLILFSCYVILLLFEVVCKGFLSLPYASFITGKLSVWQILLWYGLVGGFLLGKRFVKKISIIPLVVVLSLLLILQKTPDFEVNFLYVGQGDGIYLSTGDGTSIFIDGGSTDVSKVGTYRILPFLKCNGIRKIDYWFVSHCDADHISGLCEVIEENYRIKHLVVAEYMQKDDAWLKLEELAKQDKIKILHMNQGDCIKSGDKGENKGWSIKCLAPGADTVTEDRNENSLALLFESKACNGYFAGDMGVEQERKLVQQWDLPKVDVYKASHHGSNGSNSMELLEKIQPEMAVVSCGLKNRYGHPGKETLERLQNVGSKIMITAESGEIVIRK